MQSFYIFEQSCDFCCFHLTSVRRLICLGRELNIYKVVSERNLERGMKLHLLASLNLFTIDASIVPMVSSSYLLEPYPVQYFPTHRLPDLFFASSTLSSWQNISLWFCPCPCPRFCPPILPLSSAPTFCPPLFDHFFHSNFFWRKKVCSGAPQFLQIKS